MQQAETNYRVEDKEQVDELALSAFKVREILAWYQDERQLTMISERTVLNTAGLTETITTIDKVESTRNIKPFYQTKSIEAGIMSAEEIHEAKNRQISRIEQDCSLNA